MKQETIKKLSFTLICAATILLAFIVVDILGVFKRETGILDFMPDFLIKGIFYSYFILLVLSYILFLASTKIKYRFDQIAKTMYLVNGFILLFFLVVYAIEMVKSL